MYKKSKYGKSYRNLFYIPFFKICKISFKGYSSKNCMGGLDGTLSFFMWGVGVEVNTFLRVVVVSENEIVWVVVQMNLKKYFVVAFLSVKSNI